MDAATIEAPPRGRRLASLLFVALMTVGAIVLISPRPAHAACTCQATKAERGMADAAVVFLGTLTEISPPIDGVRTLGFDVRLVYKGDVAAQASIQTFASAEDCGVGNTAKRGDWLVFAYAIPGGDGLPLLSTCSPSMLLTATTRLPVEIGQGKAPPGAAAYTPADAGPVVSTFYGSVTDPQDTRNSILEAAAVLVAVAVLARILAGRRRFIVR